MCIISVPRQQCRPRSGPHLDHMDFTRARCELDLGQNYVAGYENIADFQITTETTMSGFAAL